VSGTTSCNDYSGPYVTDAGTIAIGPLASTKALCDGLMEQESRYLAALESAATYTVTAGRLELRTAEKALAVSMIRSGS
jgi:heat shock protein HslJ